MNKSYLIELLSDASEEEVYIEDEEGVQYDIEVERQDETFDGFYTAYPACIVLKKVTNCNPFEQ